MKKLQYEVIFTINKGIEELLDSRNIHVNWKAGEDRMFKAEVSWANVGSVEPSEAEMFGKKIVLASEVANELNKYQVKGICSDEYELDLEDKKKIVHLIKNGGDCMREEVFGFIMNKYGQEA